MKKSLDDSKIVVELAVIRGVGQNTPMSDKLYDWLTGVVDAACGLCRNIRVVIFLSFIWDNSQLIVLLAYTCWSHESNWHQSWASPYSCSWVGKELYQILGSGGPLQP